MDDEHFSLFRDFRRVLWIDTLRLNFVRALCTGTVFAAVAMWMHFFSNDPNMRTTMPLAMLPFVPVVYAIFLFPVFALTGRALAWISAITSNDLISACMGYCAFFFVLFTALGDPLACALHKRWPSLIPVTRFRLFNLTSLIFVLLPTSAEPA